MIYKIHTFTKDYKKYLGFIKVDNITTVLTFIEAYLLQGYNIDIKIIYPQSKNDNAIIK